MELRMKIGQVIRNITQRVVYLVKTINLFCLQVLHGYSAFTAKRHGPKAVETGVGINCYWN
jgi:hypothetical protein